MARLAPNHYKGANCPQTPAVSITDVRFAQAYVYTGKYSHLYDKNVDCTFTV